ncbi:hypothetical protein GOP47_0011373 [Adiantum capillus-veneris]|uniref:Ionotropic glutamate receptor L-glutamate and glycine-binding domain-containing protein n=1 Tax=Adiantum capillus-veneris TaxID=13818 RepID=A0A9D4ZHK6_ADICA|nr:hypothetical protein GOP47_0011373 [Adiantum capillus-veneris]
MSADDYGIEKKLVILVPRKVGFRQFATASCEQGGHNCSFSGFAVEVFQTCITRLSREQRVRFKFRAYGDGTTDPSYDGMVEALKAKVVEGIVGDLTITAQRMEDIDFTHPYIQSTLVALVPYQYAPRSQNLWIFLQPFSRKLWISVVLSFVVTGIVIFILEHTNEHFHKEGLGWRTQLANVFW